MPTVDFDRLRATLFPDGHSDTYSYDQAGRLVKKIDRKGVVKTSAYDEAGRLISKSYSDGTRAGRTAITPTIFCNPSRTMRTP